MHDYNINEEYYSLKCLMIIENFNGHEQNSLVLNVYSQILINK